MYTYILPFAFFVETDIFVRLQSLQPYLVLNFDFVRFKTSYFSTIIKFPLPTKQPNNIKNSRETPSNKDTETTNLHLIISKKDTQQNFLTIIGT